MAKQTRHIKGSKPRLASTLAGKRAPAGSATPPVAKFKSTGPVTQNKRGRLVAEGR